MMMMMMMILCFWCARRWSISLSVKPIVKHNLPNFSVLPVLTQVLCSPLKKRLLHKRYLHFSHKAATCPRKMYHFIYRFSSFSLTVALKSPSQQQHSKAIKCFVLFFGNFRAVWATYSKWMNEMNLVNTLDKWGTHFKIFFTNIFILIDFCYEIVSFILIASAMWLSGSKRNKAHFLFWDCKTFLFQWKLEFRC